MRGNNYVRLCSSFVLIVFGFSMVLCLMLTPIAQGASPVGWYNQQWDQTSPVPESIDSVDAVDVSTAWVGGSYGSILKTTDGGSTWNKQLYTGGCIYDIRALNSSTAWVIASGGNYGANNILKTTDGGANWNSQYKSEVLSGPRSLAIANANTVWATVAGEILKTDDGGNSWMSQGANKHVNDVYAVSSTTAWAVGDGGTVLKTTDGGANWNNQPTGISNKLLSVSAVDSTNAWVVGENGAILHTTDGTSWNVVLSSGPTLTGIVAVDINVAWAVGGSGLILKTTDGGATARNQYPWPPLDLKAIDAIDENTAWAVGADGTIFHTTDGGDGNLPRPYIATVSASAFVGQEVTILGVNFGADRGTSYVSFGSVDATQYNQWSDNSIKCIVPSAYLPGLVPITVTTNNGVSNSRQYEILYGTITVSSISPNWGYSTSTMNMEITGTGFPNGAVVELYATNLIPWRFPIPSITVSNTVVVSDTKIRCTLTIPSYVSCTWAMNVPCQFSVSVRAINRATTGAPMFTVQANPFLCGVGSIAPIVGFTILMGMLSFAGTIRTRKRRRRR